MNNIWSHNNVEKLKIPFDLYDIFTKNNVSEKDTNIGIKKIKQYAKENNTSVANILGYGVRHSRIRSIHLKPKEYNEKMNTNRGKIMENRSTNIVLASIYTNEELNKSIYLGSRDICQYMTMYHINKALDVPIEPIDYLSLFAKLHQLWRSLHDNKKKQKEIKELVVKIGTDILDHIDDIADARYYIEYIEFLTSMRLDERSGLGYRAYAIACKMIDNISDRNMLLSIINGDNGETNEIKIYATTKADIAYFHLVTEISAGSHMIEVGDLLLSRNPDGCLTSIFNNSQKNNNPTT